MSAAQVTEAHLRLANQLVSSPPSPLVLATLIADSEARACDQFRAEVERLKHGTVAQFKDAFIEELKRENAALRIIQAQDKENYQCAMKASMAVEEQLKSENAALREDLEESQRVVIETRLAAVNGMNEIRSALGLPLGHEDKSGKRVLDYVQQLKCENTGLLEAILNAPNSVCKELDRRSAARKEAQP